MRSDNVTVERKEMERAGDDAEGLLADYDIKVEYRFEIRFSINSVYISIISLTVHFRIVYKKFFFLFNEHWELW